MPFKPWLTHDEALELIAEHGSALGAARYLSETKGNGSVGAWDTRVRRALKRVLNASPAEQFGDLTDMLDDKNVDPEDVRIQGGRISFSQTAMKLKRGDGTHEVVVTPLKHTQIVFKPKKTEADLEWPVIRPANRATIKYVNKTKHVEGQPERVLIIPDAQINFWKDIRTGEWTPSHDPLAIETLLAVAADYKPHRVVILGDFLDCASLSKYLQIPEFQQSLQPSIDYGYEVLARLRSIVGPSAKIDYIEGNHERRISEYIARNAAAAWGLRVAGTTGWPALSLPTLLRFDELNIEMSATYPGGQVWLTPKLVCQHQDPKSSDIRASIIHGHVPKTSISSRTVHYFEGPQTYQTHAIAGLMRIDDTNVTDRLCRTNVPSDTTRVSWNQAMAVVDIYDDNRFDIQHIQIVNGWCAWRGKQYQASI